MTEKTSHCRNCKTATIWRLHISRFVNGSSHFVWVCSVCDRPVASNAASGIYIPHDRVLEHLTVGEINALPLLMPDLSARCVVCGDRNCELHHWAPRHLFGEECEKWPKDYLCVKCHARWHELLTPNMAGF